MNIVKLDILTVSKGIIAHQVNCQGVMGAGLALKIKYKYKQAFDYYQNVCCEPFLKTLLGKVQLVQIREDFYVANLFSQFFYGREQKVYTDYDALKTCFKDLAGKSNQLGLPVYLPYKIGCGLAGGDWNIVLDIINQTLPEAIICQLE